MDFLIACLAVLLIAGTRLLNWLCAAYRIASIVQEPTG